MTAETFIQGLSREEKLETMEIIWRDLCQDFGAVQSPAWHGDVIRDRLTRPEAAGSLSLDDAKREITARLRGYPKTGGRVGQVRADPPE
jgi:hypothetical protein